MNPREGATRLCQLIRNEDVAKELNLRSVMIKSDISFDWLVGHIERSLNFPQTFDVEAVEGADAVAVLLANEHVVYEVRHLFSVETGSDPSGALKVLQRAASQPPQSTRTINQSADKLIAEIAARHPQSEALSFSPPQETPTDTPPPPDFGIGQGATTVAPPGTTVVGTARGLITPPPPPAPIPDVAPPPKPAQVAVTPPVPAQVAVTPPVPAQVAVTPPVPSNGGGAPQNGSSDKESVRNTRGQYVSPTSLQEALDAGDINALRALLG